jgi:hypothetical protein
MVPGGARDYPVSLPERTPAVPTVDREPVSLPPKIPDDPPLLVPVFMPGQVPAAPQRTKPCPFCGDPDIVGVRT